ncbi:MAG: hypothetical protein U0325_10650 [Polyangiales bacterium]
MKLLHAEELARLANVHKSTVLLAIRRGELKASRTAGRSARIAPEEARSYLLKRGCEVPAELEAKGGKSVVTLISEAPEIVNLVRAAVPSGVEFQHEQEFYTALITVGASTPDVVVVDLDLPFLNAPMIVRALRQSPHLSDVKIIAVGLRDEYFAAARSAGADETYIKVDVRGLAAGIGRALQPAPN